MERKLFTPEEANALLPELRTELERLQALAEEIETRFSELQRIKTGPVRAGDLPLEADPFFELESRLEFMRMEADLMVGNFSRKGVLLKMIAPGLLDFPAVLGGEPVLLCWKEGEEGVGHYHGWNEGFVGRRTLPDLWK